MKRLTTLCLFFCFLISTAQTTTTNNGLITLKTKTPHGNIYTYLPENYVAGKPISGSHFLEAVGSSTRDIQKNTQKLLEYGLQLGNRKFSIKEKVFSAVLNTDQLNVSVLDTKGKVIQSYSPKLLDKGLPNGFSFPKGIQSDDRSQVIGNFDGNSKTTALTLGGQTVQVLAESPVQTLFKSPKLSTGEHNFKIKENNEEVANEKVRLVNYELNAGQLNLKRGQSTFIQANITGLNFLEEPIPLTVTNLTPAVVSLQGGNSQTIMIPRQDAAFIKRWNVRSIKTGSFSISTELKLPEPEFPNSGEGVAISSDFDEKDPCKELKKSCDDLLADLNAKKAIAKTAKDKYDADKKEADRLKKIADDLEKKAKKAETDAIPPDEGATITYEGYTYKMIDHKLLDVLRAEAYDDYQDGTTNVNEYQDRLKELSGPDALKEMEKKRKELEEKLKKKAKEAREAADQAKEPYNKAKAKADASKKIADEKQAEVDVAQKAYDECMRKVKEKCDKIKAAIAQAEADRIKKQKEAEAAAAEAERIRIAEEQRLASIARNKERIQKRRKYLLDNIKELGLIGSAGIKEVPGLWDWLPDFLETPVGNLIEDRTGGVIPTDVFKALGGLYQVAGAILDPCTPLGARKTVSRLEEMTNPYTNSKYTSDEALKKTEDMCKLLRRLKAKSLQLKNAAGN
ncbi:hypothetical protein [Flagellimonas sp. 2504JD4-2]